VYTYHEKGNRSVTSLITRKVLSEENYDSQKLQAIGASTYHAQEFFPRDLIS